MIIKLIARLVVLLNSNSRAIEVGLGIALGLMLALLPAGNLLFFALLVVILLVKVNFGMSIVSFLLFRTIVPTLDPFLSEVGRWILLRPGLFGLFSRMEQILALRLTFFNDTLVMGAFVAGLCLLAPVTALSTLLVRVYRAFIHPKIANSKLVKAIKATPLVQKIAKAGGSLRSVWSVAG